MTSSYFSQLISALSELPQVDAILLAGSRGAGWADRDSDYDVYVYLNSELPVATRKLITDQFCECMELNNQFWETEDDGVLRDGNEIELIYRDFGAFENLLVQVVEQHQASLGYTTCYWANLLNSQILFDRHGRARQLQQRFSISYPPTLKQAIIDKNLPILTTKRPAYYFQLQKALRRGDRISVQHRVTGFLASYFDILFAVNELPHPGEKRLLSLVDHLCERKPENAEQDILSLISQAGEGDEALLGTVERLTLHLEAIL